VICVVQATSEESGPCVIAGAWGMALLSRIMQAFVWFLIVSRIISGAALIRTFMPNAIM